MSRVVSTTIGKTRVHPDVTNIWILEAVLQEPVFGTAWWMNGDWQVSVSECYC